MERVLHDSDFLKEMVEIFLREAATIITSIEQAASQQNLESIQRSTHSLKGCSANIGADELVSFCEKIEAALHSENLTSVEQLASELGSGLESFKSEAARALA